jgi:hypothetical protein
MADQFSWVKKRVAPVSSHRRVDELSRVLVTIIKVDETFAAHQPFAELAFINPVQVLENTETVNQPVPELALVL